MVARGSGCPNWSFGIKSEIQASTEDEMALVPMKKPWCNSELPIDKVDEALFATATRVHVHNGQMARFWTSSWLNGSSPTPLFPSLYKHSKRKNMMDA
jgi:hypothetical protein